VASGADIRAAEPLAGDEGYVIVDASTGWKIIPAENLVAAFQGKPGKLFAACATANEARLMFEALEEGTDGVLLQTNDPAEVWLA
jgi:3-dehydroquinate synthase class II